MVIIYGPLKFEGSDMLSTSARRFKMMCQTRFDIIDAKSHVSNMQTCKFKYV